MMEDFVGARRADSVPEDLGNPRRGRRHAAHEGILVHRYLLDRGRIARCAARRHVRGRSTTRLRHLPFRAPSLSTSTTTDWRSREPGSTPARADRFFARTRGSSPPAAAVNALAPGRADPRQGDGAVRTPRPACSASAGGRLALNVVTGEPGEAEQHGDFGDKADQDPHRRVPRRVRRAFRRAASTARARTSRCAGEPRSGAVGIPARPGFALGVSPTRRRRRAVRHVDLSWLEPVEQREDRADPRARGGAGHARFGVRGWILARTRTNRPSATALALEDVDRGRQAALREKLLARQLLANSARLSSRRPDVDDPACWRVCAWIWAASGCSPAARRPASSSHAEIADRFAELSSISGRTT